MSDACKRERCVEYLEMRAEIESLNKSLLVHMEGYLDAQADIERLRGLLFDVLATKQISPLPMWLRGEIKAALAGKETT